MSEIVNNFFFSNQPFAVTDWKDVTVDGSWNQNIAYTAKARRLGEDAYFSIKGVMSGAPNSVALTVNLPTGYVIDVNKMIGAEEPIGRCNLRDDSAVINYQGVVCLTAAGDTDKVRVMALRSSAAFAQGDSVSETVPMTWTNLDSFILRFSVPIVGWKSFS